MTYKKAFLIAIGAMLLLAVVGFAWILMPTNARDNVSPRKQAEMLSVTLAWGQLAPLPSSAENLMVMTSGNTFARGFHISFAAPLEDIDEWIAESPGLQNLEPEVNGAQRRYLFSSDDSVTIEVMIDESCDCVAIEAWSS